jgi:hypothetical protein
LSDGALRREAAATSERFAPSDYQVDGDSVGVSDAALQRERQEQRQEAFDNFQSETDITISQSDIRETDTGLALTDDALRREAAASSDAFGVEDFETTDDGVEVSDSALQRERREQRQEAFDEFQSETEIQLSESDIRETDSGLTLTDGALRREAAASSDVFGVSDFETTDDGVEVSDAALEREREAQRENAFSELQDETTIQLESDDVTQSDDAFRLTEGARRREATAQIQSETEADISPADILIEGDSVRLDAQAQRREAARSLQDDTEIDVVPSDFEFADDESVQLRESVQRKEAVSALQDETESEIEASDIEFTDDGATLSDRAQLREGVVALQDDTDINIGLGDVKATDDGIELQAGAIQREAAAGTPFDAGDISVGPDGDVSVDEGARESEATESFLAEQARESGASVPETTPEIAEAWAAGNLSAAYDVDSDGSVDQDDLQQLATNETVRERTIQDALAAQSDFSPGDVQAQTASVPTTTAEIAEGFASGDLPDAYDLNDDGSVGADDVQELLNNADERSDVIDEAQESAGLSLSVTDTAIEQEREEARQNQIEEAASESDLFSASDLQIVQEDGEQVIRASEQAVERERQEARQDALEEAAEGAEYLGVDDLRIVEQNGDQVIEPTEEGRQDRRQAIKFDVADEMGYGVTARSLTWWDGELRFRSNIPGGGPVQRSQPNELDAGEAFQEAFQRFDDAAEREAFIEAQTGTNVSGPSDRAAAANAIENQLGGDIDLDQSDVRLTDEGAVLRDDVIGEVQQPDTQGEIFDRNEKVIDRLSGVRTAQQQEVQAERARLRSSFEYNSQVIDQLSKQRTTQQQTKQQVRQEAADIFSQQSDVSVSADDVVFDRTSGGQLQPELTNSVRRDVNQSAVGQLSERRTTQQRVKQQTRQAAADVYSEQVGFEVPASAVNLETVSTEAGEQIRPSLDEERAREAGQNQGDIFSGAVSVTEGALAGAVERVTGRDDVDLIPGQGSVVNNARLQLETGDTDLSGTIPEPAREFGSTLGDAGRAFSRRVAQPLGDVAAVADLASSLNPRDQREAFERTERAVRAADEGDIGEAFRSLSGEAQGTETWSDRFVQGATTGAAEIANVPALGSTVISAGDVVATGATSVVQGDGAEFGAQAGAAGLAVGEQAIQAAADNPTATAGLLVGSGVAGSAVSPFRAARLDVDTKPAASRVELDTSSARATRGVETDTADTSVQVRTGEGGSTRVRGLRVQTPAVAEAFGIRARGRTVAGSRDGRPTIGSPSLESQVDELNLSTLGTTGTATAEARSAFEADVFRETASDVSSEAGERFRASEAIQRQAQLQSNPDFTVDTPEEAVGLAQAVPDSAVDDVTEALRETDATVFGSAAARAQAENFRQPRDLDIVVDDKAEAKPVLESALEGENAEVSEVFDIKETADVPGRAAGGERIKFGRTSQEPRELGGVPFNPVGEELVRKAGASAFIREPGAAGTPEFDVGPEPRRPGRPDVREKDVEDTQMLAEELGIFGRGRQRFATAFDLDDQAAPRGGSDGDGFRNPFAFGERGQADLGNFGRRREDTRVPRETREQTREWTPRERSPGGRVRDGRDRGDSSPNTDRRGSSVGIAIPSSGLFDSDGGGSPFGGVTGGSLVTPATGDSPTSGESPDSTGAFSGFSSSPMVSEEITGRDPLSPVGDRQSPSTSPSPAPGASAGAGIGPSPETAFGPSPEAGIGPSPETAFGSSPEAGIGPSPEARVGPSPEARVGPSPEAGTPPSPETGFGSSPEARTGSSPEAGTPTSPGAGIDPSPSPGPAPGPSPTPSPTPGTPPFDVPTTDPDPTPDPDWPDFEQENEEEYPPYYQTAENKYFDTGIASAEDVAEQGGFGTNLGPSEQTTEGFGTDSLFSGDSSARSIGTGGSDDVLSGGDSDVAEDIWQL